MILYQLRNNRKKVIEMVKLWESVLEELRTKISKASYETWFKSIATEITDNTILIKAPNSFARDWIAKHYESKISEILTEKTGKTYELIIVNSENRPSNIESNSSDLHATSNVYNKLINVVKEQNKLLRDQQERIDALEKRVHNLEMKN